MLSYVRRGPSEHIQRCTEPLAQQCTVEHSYNIYPEQGGQNLLFNFICDFLESWPLHIGSFDQKSRGAQYLRESHKTYLLLKEGPHVNLMNRRSCHYRRQYPPGCCTVRIKLYLTYSNKTDFLGKYARIQQIPLIVSCLPQDRHILKLVSKSLGNGCI